jgi:hypothetical protein
MINLNHLSYSTKALTMVLMLCLSIACDESDKPLAPYVGSPKLTGIEIEQGNFSPKINWLGGYVSALGVNIGTTASLDSSLIMLVHTNGNNLRYPVKFGQVPDGAEDLTIQYGGTRANMLIEDSTYTFWILKEDVWEKVIQSAGKPICIDQDLSAAMVEIREDTVYISSYNHTQETVPLDVYVNIENIRSLGKLATITLIETDTSNNPVISWEIRQAGVTDTLVAAIGLVKAQSYSPSAVVWEAWVEDTSSGQPVYGKMNLIAPPITLGQSIPGTRIFYEYPESGLERNEFYYLWIANKNWNGITHARSADYYCYITFQTY